MFFKEGVRTFISCVSEKEAEMRMTPKGKNVTSLRARCSGKWGIRYYDLTGWDAIAVAMNKGVKEGGLRLIAVGMPVEELYNGRIQHKLTVDELWVEDIEAKTFIEVVSKNGLAEEVGRIFEPLEVPVSIA